MKIFDTFCILFFLASIPCFLKAQQTDTSDKTIPEKLDEFLVSANSVNKFNGVALIAQNGKILLEKGYGFKNVASGILNNPDDIFQIASVTKQFTSTVILKLQEEKKLSVQDKLSKYFPEFKYAKKITLENLLTHTSGIYSYTNDIDDNDSAIVCNPIKKQLVLDVIFKHHLDFKPGSKFSYSNSNYYLLGLIIEKVTGKPYEEEVRELIFDPLKMKHSGFDFVHLDDTDKTTGYRVLNANQHIAAQRWDSTVTYAAGGMYSTVADLYEWAKAVANKKIISDSSWKQAFTPHLDKYGYGWYIDSLYGKKFVGHDGGMPGFLSSIVYYPNEDVTLILLNNEGYYNEGLTAVYGGLSGIVFNKPYLLIRKHEEIKLPDSILKQYVGVYQFTKKHKVFITLENGRLQIASPAGNLPKSPLFADDNTTFFLELIEVDIEFVKDPDGNTLELIAHENGKDEVCKKIK